MKISFYSSRDKEKWDNFAENHPESTFFHLSGWKEILETSFRHKPYYIMAEEGDRIKGILPLFHIKNILFGNSLVSIPFVVYGGICAEDSDTYKVLLEEGKKIARQLRVNYMELRNVKHSYSDLPQKDLYVYFMRELYDDNEKNMAAIPRKQRRMIRIGIKNGFQSKVGNEHFNDFYNIFAESYRNLGSPVFPYNYMKKIVQVFGDKCRILSVWRNGRMDAAVMTFFFKDKVLPYYGGALKDSFKYAVNDFMYWELMRYGYENGFKMFDFGRSKKGTGAYNFKRHWGFEPTPLPYEYFLVKQNEMPDLSPVNPKFNAMISVWKKLPLTVTKYLGPKIIRYIP